MNNKKRNKFYDNIDIIRSKINNKFTIPNNINYNNKIEKLNNSWFSINEYNLDNKNNINLVIENSDKLDSYDYKTKSIQIFLTDIQKSMLNKWIESYRLMLNHTIKYFKKEIYNKNQLNPNFINIRKSLTEIKKKIEEKSIINNKKIYTHTLDYAIKDICTNLKSILTNLKENNIKRFRLRYIKKYKNNQYIKFEKTTCKTKNNKDNTFNFIINAIGEIKSKESKIEVDCDYSIIKKNGKFFLQIPVKTIKTKLENNKIIGFDLGVRTFISGYNQDKVVDICNNAKDKLNRIHEKIDKLNSELEKKKINKPTKEKAAKKQWYKLKNIVNELHWKSIKYITDNYENVIMGNISTKSILKNKKTEESVKRYVCDLSFFKFKERLKYKCSIKGIKLKLIDENFTSKLCSSCGNRNEGENKTKEYKCQKCKIELDRDYNGAKNILILGSKIKK